MYYPIFALLLLVFSMAPLWAQENSSGVDLPKTRVFLLIQEGTHMDLPALREMGVRILSLRPDPGAPGDILVEAMVTEDTFKTLEYAGMLRRLPDGGESP